MRSDWLRKMLDFTSVQLENLMRANMLHSVRQCIFLTQTLASSQHRVVYYNFDSTWPLRGIAHIEFEAQVPPAVCAKVTPRDARHTRCYH
jgi:hypothetical protein